MTDDRTADMALLPAEREMSPEVWAEYGGLPAGLRGYCFRLMRQEADARVHVREAELEVAEWRDRSWRLLSRAGAAEAEVERLRAELAQARADALVLLAECHSADVADGGDFFGSSGMLAQAGLTATELHTVRRLPVAGDDPAALLALVRRVLGGAR